MLTRWKQYQRGWNLYDIWAVSKITPYVLPSTFSLRCQIVVTSARVQNCGTASHHLTSIAPKVVWRTKHTKLTSNNWRWRRPTVASPRLCLSQKVALKHTSKSTTNGLKVPCGLRFKLLLASWAQQRGLHARLCKVIYEGSSSLSNLYHWLKDLTGHLNIEI